MAILAHTASKFSSLTIERDISVTNLKILCLGKLPSDLAESLTLGTLTLVERERLDEPTLTELLKDTDILLCEPQDTIYKGSLEAAPKLKMIAQRAVGYDNIPLDDATKLNILVTNTPGVLDNATADLAFGLLLATARRIAEADKYVRAKLWTGFQNDLMLGSEISGKTIGLIGMGRIARAMARRARGFDMRVIYCRSPKKETAPKLDQLQNLDQEKASVKNQISDQEADLLLDQTDLELAATLGAKRVSLATVLAESDFISLHCPLNESTRELIGPKEFAAMKRSCIFINTGRGRLVDEKALIDALQQGQIKAAGLDVFYDEPQIPTELLQAPNVVLTPHIGSASAETRYNMAKLAVDGVLQAFSGTLPGNALNGQIYSHWSEKISRSNRT